MGTVGRPAAVVGACRRPSPLLPRPSPDALRPMPFALRPTLYSKPRQLRSFGLSGFPFPVAWILTILTKVRGDWLAIKKMCRSVGRYTVGRFGLVESPCEVPRLVDLKG